MRVALISAEYAPTVWRGGIGTYMVNLARMLANRDHDVEVFAALDRTFSEYERPNLRVNFVACNERHDFPSRAAEAFRERHRAAPFDLIESAEFLAEYAPASKVAPDVPLVVKLHTSSAVARLIEGNEIPIHSKARFMLGGLLRLQWPRPFWRPIHPDDNEYEATSACDEMTSPCRAMVDMTARVWPIDPTAVHIVPNVFFAPDQLTQADIKPRGGRVLYVGRLEIRKGVLNLAHAIVKACDADRSIRFTILGRSLNDHSGRPLIEIMQKIIGRHSSRVNFLGGLPYEDALRHYNSADVVVVPSIWENFPNTCLEAMCAGKAVIASRAGGMAEIIEDDRSGVLVDPHDPQMLARQILSLSSDTGRMERLGIGARNRVLTNYSEDAVAPVHEDSFLRSINSSRRRRQGSMTEEAG